MSPRIAIFGHTHAARKKHIEADRVYINTGTWMDLMAMRPIQNDSDMQTWIEQLENGVLPRTSRWTCAEVTEAGASLQEVCADGSRQELGPSRPPPASGEPHGEPRPT